MSDLPKLVDSHCHLDSERLEGGPEEAIRRANDAGVAWMQSICTTRRDFDDILPIAQRHAGVFCSYGIHPHHVDDNKVDEKEIMAHAEDANVIGIGETGLDYFYENSTRANQQSSFHRHIRAARKLDLPVIIHTRDAEDDTIAILEEALQEGPFKILFHCFSSNRKLAQWGMDNDAWFSASGIITFKRSADLRDVFAQVPANRVLVETDAPYLAPEPFRGKICEPAHVVYTAQHLAQVRGVEFEEIARTTTDNFFTLFSKAQA